MTVRTVDTKLNTARKPKSSQINERRLSSQDIQRLAGIHPGDAILVTQGILWVTQEGDPNDYVLSAGERFIANRRGSVVVEALTDASLRFSRN